MAWRVLDRRSRFPLLAIALGLTLPGPSAPAREPAPAEARLRADVAYLADDAREGRAPGTKGIDDAATYIAAAFAQAGLKPAAGDDDFFQDFQIGGDAVLGAPTTLALHGPDDRELKAARKTDFAPLALGGAGKLQGVPVVFAGYGISAEDEAKDAQYDDYAGLDVKGKAVLILRREPRQDEDESGLFQGPRDTRYADLRTKASNAFGHGAAAVLMVNNTASLTDGEDRLLGLNDRGSTAASNLPFVMLSRAFADRLLAAAGQPSLDELEKQIDADLKPRSRALEGWTLDASIPIERTKIETRNVVGVLEGAGPHADETVVVGAHYDHLGHGGLFSGSLAFLSRDVHNGADDNASGTATVMELARRLARRVDPPGRRIVFVAFSGEEKGLLGSQHYVNDPPYPLDRTVLMLNFDMVGRLDDANTLTVYGTQTSPGFPELVGALGQSLGFKIKEVPSGLGPSDQQSFYLKDVPVLFAFTGNHRDYHRPSDDTERINFDGMARVADLGELLLLDAVRRPERPAFTRVGRDRDRGGDPARIALRVSLGTIPEYGAEVKGVKLAGVREGSPAEKGGIQGGDVIVGLAGRPVETIEDYMQAMSVLKPGEPAEMVVERAGQKVTLKVTPEARPDERR